jgi:hypothetical protein
MTRSCSELAAALVTAGCEVTLAAERLIIRPAHKVPANLVAAIRTSKPELVAYLRSRPVCAECRQPITEPVRSWWGGEPVHPACGEAAWQRDWGDRPAEPEPWAAADWRERFDAQLAMAMIDGEQPEVEARRIAWEGYLALWCEMHPVATRDQAAAELRAMVRGERGAITARQPEKGSAQ